MSNNMLIAAREKENEKSFCVEPRDAGTSNYFDREACGIGMMVVVVSGTAREKEFRVPCPSAVPDISPNKKTER